MYTFDENIVSDLHKDARGYRPRDVWWTYWSNCTDAEKQREWDGLIRELDEEMDRTRKAEARAALALTERLDQMYELGAKTEVQALKWIIEAEQFDEFDLQYGASYFCYHFGLSYSAEKDFRIQEAINEILSEVV
jgi:putative heme iron utilization protein